MLNRQRFKFRQHYSTYKFAAVERRLNELVEFCKTEGDFTVSTAIGTSGCYVTYFTKQEWVATPPAMLYNIYLMKRIIAEVVYDELDLIWVEFKI